MLTRVHRRVAMQIRRPLALAGPGSPGRAGGLARGRLPRRSRCRVPGREPADLQPDAPAGLSPGRTGGHDRPHRDLRLGGGGGPGAGGPRAGRGRSGPSVGRGAPHPPFGHPLPAGEGWRPGWRRSGWRWRRSGTRPRPDRPSTAGTAWAGVPSFDPEAPAVLRISLASAALGLASLVAVSLWIARRGRFDEECSLAKPGSGCRSWSPHSSWPRRRQFEIPGVEPVGYWPRWAWVWGLAAFDLALIRAMPPLGERSRLAACGGALGGAAAWSALVAGGIWLTWYHRPLERLRVVEPGRIFISAMPTPRGLEVAHGRHRFKTIINLFPEKPPLRHPLHPDEVRFAREHGIRYVESPGGRGLVRRVPRRDPAPGTRPRRLADPGPLPRLHGPHARLDGHLPLRRPGAPAGRDPPGDRAASRVSAQGVGHAALQPGPAPRAPERYAADPTASLLRACAEGTRDPYEDQLRAEARARTPRPRRVSLAETPRAPADRA